MATIHTSDSRIMMWDVRDHPAVGQPLIGHQAEIWHLCVSRGNSVVTGAKDGTIGFWDTDKRALRAEPEKAFQAAVWSIACARSANVVVTTDGVNVIIWDAALGKRTPEQLPEIIWGINQLSLSPDGTLLAEALEGMDMVAWMPAHPPGYPRMVVWNLNTRMPIRLPTPISARAVQFSPDGKLLAAADKELVLLSVDTWKPIGPPLQVGLVSVDRLAFTPDGNTLLCFGFNGQTEEAQLFDVKTGHRIGSAWVGFDDTPKSVDFSADGSIMIVSTSSESIRFWDMATREPLGTPINAAPAALMTGDSTLVLARKGVVEFRDSLLVNTRQRACRRANRNLTASEWNQFVGHSWPYCRTCAEFPAGSGAPVGAPACTEPVDR